MCQLALQSIPNCIYILTTMLSKASLLRAGSQFMGLTTMAIYLTACIWFGPDKNVFLKWWLHDLKLSAGKHCSLVCSDLADIAFLHFLACAIDWSSAKAWLSLSALLHQVTQLSVCRLLSSKQFFVFLKIMLAKIAPCQTSVVTWKKK